MKLGIISLGGKSSQSILKESRQFFKESDHLDIRKIEVHATSKELNVLFNKEAINNYDCIYVRGSYKYALLQRSLTEALYKKTYMPLKPRSFTLGHNKFLTLLELQNHKVPLPTTYLAATTEGAKRLLGEVNYPIIMKIPSGTQGKGVMFADSIESAKSILDTLEVFKQPYIIQEYLETGATDIRAIVAGDNVIACMRRKAMTQDLRANIHAGGVGTSCELDYDTQQIAIKAARAIDADVCAVDILESTKPVVIEVNLSPGLRGITNATNKNVAKEIAQFLYDNAKSFKERMNVSSYNKIINDIDIANGKKEIITNLDIKAEVIKLPSLITKITRFKSSDEVVLIAKEGKLIIKKHEV